MHGLMAASAPTRAATQSAGRAVIGTANDDARRRLLLEMALQAEIGVARDQHLVIDGAVRIVTGGTAFTHRLMFEDKRSALCGMALAASIVLRQQCGASAANRRAFVRIVAIA